MECGGGVTRPLRFAGACSLGVNEWLSHGEDDEGEEEEEEGKWGG